MTRLFVGLAGHTLRQQVEIFGDEAVSLHSLWRAAGRPEGHSPRVWVGLANSLIAGYADYMANLNPGLPVVWVFEGDDGDPWRVGDLMGRGDLAQIYADYLDSAAPALDCRDTNSAAG